MTLPIYVIAILASLGGLAAAGLTAGVMVLQRRKTAEPPASASQPAAKSSGERKAKRAKPIHVSPHSSCSHGELMEEIPLEPIVFMPASATPFSKFELVRSDAGSTLPADPATLMLYPPPGKTGTMPVFDASQSSLDYIHYPSRAALPKLPTRGSMALSRHATPQLAFASAHSYHGLSDGPTRDPQASSDFDGSRLAAMERTFGSVTIV